MKSRLIPIVMICLGLLGIVPITIITHAEPIFVNMGSISIAGAVTCSPINNYQIKVRSNGNTINIQVYYSISAPGASDQAFCDISFVGEEGSDSRTTTESDSGYMLLTKLMLPGESFTVKLHAKLTDLFGVITTGEQIRYAYGTVVGVTPPVVQFLFSPSIPVINETVTFTDQTTSLETTIQSWFWDFGDGSSATEQNSSHLYKSSGNFTVTLRVTDDFGQIISKSKNITITARPIAYFIFTPPAPTTGNTIQFTDLSYDDDGNITAWSWDFGDGNSSSLQNPTHNYKKSGTYAVSLKVTDNNGAVSTIKKISIPVKEKPLPGFEILIALIAIVFVLFLMQKSKKKNE